MFLGELMRGFAADFVFWGKIGKRSPGLRRGATDFCPLRGRGEGAVHAKKQPQSDMARGDTRGMKMQGPVRRA